MKLYETGFLISPGLSEEETEKLILQMADVISQKKGHLLKQERWGKRRLAYPIKRCREAFYVFFHYEGEPDVTAELERKFRQTEAVLRHMTLRREAKESVRKKKRGAKEKRETITPDRAAEAAGAAEKGAFPEDILEEVK